LKSTDSAAALRRQPLANRVRLENSHCPVRVVAGWEQEKKSFQVAVNVEAAQIESAASAGHNPLRVGVV
jgi:hypothetical protein